MEVFNSVKYAIESIVHTFFIYTTRPLAWDVIRVRVIGKWMLLRLTFEYNDLGFPWRFKYWN